MLLESEAAEKNVTFRPSLPPSFVSKTTTIGLRITISSVVEMVDSLLKLDEFEFVLTRKLNQDCLEVSRFLLF